MGLVASSIEHAHSKHLLPMVATSRKHEMQYLEPMFAVSVMDDCRNI